MSSGFFCNSLLFPFEGGGVRCERTELSLSLAEAILSAC